MDKLLGLLGLCARAGKLQSGAELALKLIRGRRAYLVLLDTSASANTRKQMADACRQYDVLFHMLPGNVLGSAIGKQGRMVAAVTDQALSTRLVNLIETESE